MDGVEGGVVDGGVEGGVVGGDGVDGADGGVTAGQDGVVVVHEGMMGSTPFRCTQGAIAGEAQRPRDSSCARS